MSRYKKPSHRREQKNIWPVVGIAIGLLLLGGAAWASWGQSPTAAVEVTGQPSLKVNQETIDLGDQKLGNTVEASFTLTNVGDQPLRFTEAPYVEVVEGC